MICLSLHRSKGKLLFVLMDGKCCRCALLTLWRPLGFRNFRKKSLNAHGFAREFLWSGMLYRPGKSLKRHGKSSSLHSKKNFLLGGCGFFVSDVISGGLLGHLGPLCLALGTNRQVVVFRWSFYWKLGYNPSLLIFGWPAGVSGSKVMM